MRRLPSRKRGTLVVWLAIATAIVVAIYRLSVTYLERSRFIAAPYLDSPLEGWVTNAMVFWALTLLLAACRLWREASERQRELQRILEGVSPDVLLVVERDHTVRVCNPSVRAMFGYAPEELVGRKVDLLYLDRSADGQPETMMGSLHKYAFHVGQATGRRRTGETIPLEIVAGEMEGGGGAVVLIRDIRERKQAEKQILDAKEEAEAAHRAKARALADLEAHYARLKELERMRDNLMHLIVHDMKNALFGISGSLEMLMRSSDGGLPEPQRQYARGALDFTCDLLDMVKSLLDVSRMEAGEMPLARAECDLAALVSESLRRLEPLAGEKQVRLIWTPAPVEVVCDADVVRRVISNIAGNAVKFAPAGSEVRVTATVENGRALVTVTDSGPGIPPEYYPRIFEKFGRVESEAAETAYSTGLGLYFCRLAVEAHGGAIGVRSRVGEGSAFWFWLPC
jgi:PAS domain S-box-containing protein